MAVSLILGAMGTNYSFLIFSSSFLAALPLLCYDFPLLPSPPIPAPSSPQHASTLLNISLFLASDYLNMFAYSLGLMLLGFCSSAGGVAQSYWKEADSQSDNDKKEGYKFMSQGYGFASFAYISAFLLISAGIFHHDNPLKCYNH